MFSSFFPSPKLFFPAAVLWTALGIALWYGLARDLGPQLSLGGLMGFAYPPDSADGAAVAVETARNIWLYQYMIAIGGIFVVLVGWLMPHRWFRWSVGVSAVIVFFIWFQVQLDVMINVWFGTFYNMIQQALAKPNAVTLEQFFGQLLTFAGIAMVYITTAVLLAFVTSHYIFRWRTAMNDYYVANWHRLRHVEGASQRIQEDTQRFATTLEQLGESLISALMTLIAFIPILWGLSVHVKELPLIGEIPQALVFVAVIWAALGTALLAIAGIRLPGLEFRNQRVEAAYRKELVLGEDDADRAQPPTLTTLFRDVRANYFRLYFNFLYFNVCRYGYLQASVLVPYIALAPSIVAGGLTLGVMQQIIRAFNRVEGSFQYLVRSWTTIVSLISIYKRLRAFEALMADEPLAAIEAEVLPQQS
ncbi:MAG: peptide antibiotic transporter SbmA [Reyranella sp.]|uniref:peptide antibiotic transporter SbmA n=1 Tax=Reyranella sp. TaxID=1929291 RepID=UPI0027317850|nr:peptide antibiotic transporter SbmA [Reyranella sp.]MDP1967541.1 peptide antibiotic transporter SbmA [Reyranella sp.]MDP2372266.1 peptide antibiotic transporter SbmA [Reyranella sp.]